MEAMTASRGDDPRGHRRRDPRRLPLSSPRARASSASRPARPSVAGLLRYGADGARRVVCVLDRPRPEGPADRARPGRRGRRLRAGRSPPSSAPSSGLSASPAGPRPRARRRTSGRASTPSPPRSRCTSSSRWSRPAASASRPTSHVARDRRNLACAPSRGCTRRTASRSASARRSRCRAGSARAPRRTSPALLAAAHLFDAAAGPARPRDELEGHPDNVAAALLGGFVIVTRRRPRGSSRRPGSEAVLVVPHAAVRTAAARRAAAAGAAGRRRRQRRPRRAAHARASRAATSAWSAAASTTACTSPTARTSSRARWRCLARAVARRARRDDLRRRADRPVLDAVRATGGVVDALRREAEGWADVLRAPFESMGADVREL